jgi:hypothetical protein
MIAMLVHIVLSFSSVSKPGVMILFSVFWTVPDILKFSEKEK